MEGGGTVEGFQYRSKGPTAAPLTDKENDHPILCKEVEAAVQSLKKGKLAGVDNVPAELVGGRAVFGRGDSFVWREEGSAWKPETFE